MEEYTYQADKFVFHVRKDLLYSRDEIWVKVEGDHMRVGLTDFAQWRGGDVVFAETQPVGTRVANGGLLGSYESIKLVQDIISPIDGDITETNPLFDSTPEFINSDPYGEGWVAVIKPASGTEGLLSAEEYFELMKGKVDEELKTLKGL